jgi:hypothetical protein
MKPFFFLLAAFLAMSACKSTEESSRKSEKVKIGDDFHLTFEKTACYGRCPTYKVEVFRDGKVSFEGIRFVDNVGMFEKKISRKKVKALIATLRQANFWELEDEYDSNISDLPSVITTCVQNGQEKTVKARFNIPDDVVEMNDRIEEIIGLEGYTEVEVQIEKNE